MSYCAGSTASAIFLDEVKAAHWGTFQRAYGHALERFGNLNMASASQLAVHLDSSLGCVHIAQSRFWKLLFVCNSYTSSR